MNGYQWLKWAASQLEQRLNLSGREAKTQAQWLLCAGLGTDWSGLWARLREPVPPELEPLLQRRLAGRPLQYVMGNAAFMGLPYSIDERALIPRQDTELLAELALSHIAGRPLRVLDVGTGPGTLALALAKLSPARVTALDISRRALSLAAENRRRLGLTRRVTLLQSDVTHALPRGARFDLIVSNPPYLTPGDWAQVHPDLRREPANAFLGGEDGLHFYRRLAVEANRHLRRGGCLLLEVGFGQAEPVAELLARHFDRIRIHPDLNEIPRVVAGTRKD